MSLWLLAAASVGCALAGIALGRWFSRLRSPYWMIGFIIPLILVILHALALRVPAMMFAAPFAWMTMGIKKFATFGFIATLVLTTPLSRVPRRRDRLMLATLTGVVAFYMCLWPFLAPLFARNQLMQLRTKVDQDGICLQSTDYTCGPASAVTALRRLNLPAEEGQIAILSCTSGQQGTPVDMLGEALRKEYRAQGLQVKCMAFKSLSELRQAGLTLAVIKYSLLQDHWVTVIGVTDSEVILGDPLAGLIRIPHEDFLKRWRFVGIVLNRS